MNKRRQNQGNQWVTSSLPQFSSDLSTGFVDEKPRIQVQQLSMTLALG